MTLLHIINAIAWFANAVTWMFYAGSTFMGLASCAATAVAAYMAWRAE